MAEEIISDREKAEQEAKALEDSMRRVNEDFAIPTALLTNLTVKGQALEAYAKAKEALGTYKKLALQDAGHIRSVVDAIRQADEMV